MRYAVALPLCALLAGCGLISSDVDDFNLALPEKQFIVDTADWMLMGTGTVPDIACPAVDCAMAQSMLCSGTCTAECVLGSCEVSVPMGLFAPVNLATDKPELAMVDQQNGVRVTIDTVVFNVTTNTLNVATPALDVYMAPITVTSPTSPMAQKVGTIASVAPGTMPMGGIGFTPEGRTVMQQYMSDYKTPFNFIVGGVVKIRGGDALPTGRLEGVITGTAHADAI